MAVPKKRRIGYKILNKGQQARSWYSRMFGLALSGMPLSNLKRLIGAPKTSSYGTYLHYLTLNRVPRQKLEVSSKKKRLLKVLPTERPFDREACPFSVKELICHHEYRVFLNYNSAGAKVSPTVTSFLAWQSLSLLKTRRTSHVPAWASVLPRSQEVSILIKEVLVALQLPHKWGSQRGLLLKRWELSPSYLSLGALKSRVVPGFHCGCLKFSYPTNLTRPTGPTLKGLWLYIKTNPNEGYWMYCMWLQIIKKWKRWGRFPYQYVVRRNVWRRSKLGTLFYESLGNHRICFSKANKGLYSLKGRGKRAGLSLLTNIALSLNAASLLKLKTRQTYPSDLGRLPRFSVKRRLRYFKLRTRFARRAFSLGVTLFSSLKSWFKHPLK